MEKHFRNEVLFLLQKFKIVCIFIETNKTMISQKLECKPLSVNECWQGKRYKTPAYKHYETKLMLLLNRAKVCEGKLMLYIRFGLSNKNADNDNPLKPTQDILSKFYGFNDCRIYETRIVKEDVPKGKEYIYFEISEYIDGRIEETLKLF